MCLFEHNLHESQASVLSQVTLRELKNYTCDCTGISNAKADSNFRVLKM